MALNRRRPGAPLASNSKRVAEESESGLSVESLLYPTTTTASSSAGPVYRLVPVSAPNDGQFSTGGGQSVYKISTATASGSPSHTVLMPARTSSVSTTGNVLPIQMQQVDTRTGQCYLLMNSQEFNANNAVRVDDGSRGSAQPVNATFIPLTRIEPSQTGMLSVSDDVDDDPETGGQQGQHEEGRTYTTKRKVSHNEVEKRRRDKINQWITKLARMLPDDEMDETPRQLQSKGGILSKTVDFIAQLKNANVAMCSTIDLLKEENNGLRRDINETRTENAELRQRLNRAGLDDTIIDVCRVPIPETK